jgi:hypothetical protein
MKNISSTAQLRKRREIESQVLTYQLHISIATSNEFAGSALSHLEGGRCSHGD